jgi:DinB superfamily
MFRFLLLAASAAALAYAQNPLTDAVMTRYKNIRQSLLDSAEVMPADSYSFRLTPAQRTFAEWVGHVASGNFGYCAVIKGEKTPDTSHIHDAADKAVLSQALKKSFDYCDAALAGMTDAKALAAASVGGKQLYPVTGMVNLVSSGNEHYGNMVGYMRAKGITPPSTARAKK